MSVTAVTTPPLLWLGTSWKMTKTLAEARGYADGLRSAVSTGHVPPELQLFVLPPTTALAAVRDRLGADSPVLVGAQNAYPGPEGAVTGEVSVGMVRDAGAGLVEIGHAERRTLLGETDALVAAKVAATASAGLISLVCVGETAVERDRGDTVAVLAHQVRTAISGLARTDAGTVPIRLLVAYEPHWAIGTGGQAAVPDDIVDALAVVRQILDEELTRAETGVLYGGSVDAGNATDLVAHLDIDGLFVGRAAWTVAGFLDLAQSCAAAVRTRGTTDPMSATARKDR